MRSQVKTEVCAIVKDEEDAIAEWIAYQKVIGFGTVTIYDNGSEDATGHLLRRIADSEPSLIVRDWPDVAAVAPQRAAYRDALMRSEAEWIAFLDVDEFLVLHRAQDIDEYLNAAPPWVGAIAVNWRIFGSSGMTKAEDGLTVERFARCAPAKHPKNRFFKSIVRREMVGDVDVHRAELASGRYVDGSFDELTAEASNAKLGSVNTECAQINHYLLKSWDEFVAKRRRGNASRSAEAADKYTHRGSISAPPRWYHRRTRDNEYWMTHDLNACIDRSLADRADAIRAKIRAWGLEPGAPYAPGRGIDMLLGAWRIFVSNVRDLAA